MNLKIDQSVFKRRRQALLNQLPVNSVAVIAGAEMHSRNSDVEYPFRQDSSFYYFTGFNEPDAVAVIKHTELGHGEYVLFCQDKDPELEIWTGYRTGPEGCKREYGADEAWPIDDLDDEIERLLDGTETLFYLMGSDEGLDAQVQRWLNGIRSRARKGAVEPKKLCQLASIISEMRLFKQSEEVEVIRQVCELSAEAHIRAMEYCKPGVYEYQLEAEITHHFASGGCRQSAYPSIVGGGKNACILHYTENDQPLNAGDLVLIDAGAEMDYYAADITRTFPVDGRFGEEQKAIYELVLKAQEACIALCVPGTGWDELHQRSVDVLVEGLIELGLLSGDKETLIADEEYRRFYMHRIGHWLGMDVHDVGEHKIDGEWRNLESGMLLTVEPGIYIAPDDETVEERWRGIGVRIEDNVLITAQGHEVLTVKVPKTVAEIEALMA